MTVGRVKNSVGIWSFGANATRFMPGGYHPEALKEDMPTKVRRVVDGLGDLVDGYEFHYPGRCPKTTSIGCWRPWASGPLRRGAGAVLYTQYALGSFINPDLSFGGVVNTASGG